jgi:hypothetical protein
MGTAIAAAIRIVKAAIRRETTFFDIVDLIRTLLGCPRQRPLHSGEAFDECLIALIGGRRWPSPG